MPKSRPKYVPTPEKIDTERQVLELRRAGLTFDVIAERLGLPGRSVAYRHFRTGLTRTLQQPAAEVRELEADRLDRLHAAFWPAALRGDPAAADRILRIAERRARLLGLDHADGLAERMVRLDEQQGQAIVEVLRWLFGELGLSERQEVRLREAWPGVVARLGAEDGDVITGEIEAP